MERRDLVLAAMATAGEERYSPVQIQKMFFLIDRNMATETGGPHFNFGPYNYGPFDVAVYEELEGLSRENLVVIQPCQTWKTYALTAGGLDLGRAVLETLSPEVRDYVERVSRFVRGLSFTQLVSAIYRAFPDMKANSVFRG